MFRRSKKIQKDVGQAVEDDSLSNVAHKSGYSELDIAKDEQENGKKSEDLVYIGESIYVKTKRYNPLRRIEDFLLKGFRE